MFFYRFYYSTCLNYKMINIVIHDVDKMKLLCFVYIVMIMYEIMINHVRKKNKIV